MILSPNKPRARASQNGRTAGFTMGWLLLASLVIIIAVYFLAGRTTTHNAASVPSTNTAPVPAAVSNAPSPETQVQPPQSDFPNFDELPAEEKATILSSQGEAFLEARQYPQAVNAFRESLKHDRAMESVHYNLGIAHARMEQWQEAIAAYKDALELAPDYAEAHNNLGNVLVKIGRLDEAIQHFQEAIRVNPEDAVNHNNLGTALARRGRVAEAKDEFARAVSLSPQYLEARFNLGNAFLQQGHVQDAAREFQDILQIDPQYAPARQALARIAKAARPKQ